MIETNLITNIVFFIANHGGVPRGSQGWLMVIPDRKMVVAVMMNSNVEEFWDFGQVSMPLARLFFTKEGN